MWLLIVGFVSPLVLAVIQQPGWSNSLRSVVAFVYSFVAAAGTLLIQGDVDFTAKNYLTAGLTVLVATIAFYRGFWRTSGTTPETSVTGRLERLTSPK